MTSHPLPVAQLSRSSPLLLDDARIIRVMDDGSRAELSSHLAAAARPERADEERAYLKSDIEHLGVSLPDTRSITLRWMAAHGPTLSDADELWSEPIHELRMAAIEIATALQPSLSPDDIDIIERWLREARTWAMVDPLATHVAGPLLERHPRGAEIVERWARDNDFWLRRSALLAHLKALRNGHGDFVRFGRLADDMLDEREFFIRKAIGWILRDTGRKRPDMVYEWMLPRASRASGVTIREAVKRLTPAQRDAVLAAFHDT